MRGGATPDLCEIVPKTRKATLTNPRLRVLPAHSEMVTTLIAQIVRFAHPNIQICDAHTVDLYQWVCAQYRVGVKGGEAKAKRG